MSRFFLRSSKTCRRARKCNRKMEAKQVKDDINFMKNKKNRDTLLIWATYSMSWGVGSSSPSSSSPSCCSWREETRRSVSSFPTEGTWERVFEFRRWRSLVNATTPLKKREWWWWWKVGKEGEEEEEREEGGGSVSDHAIATAVTGFYPMVPFWFCFSSCGTQLA